MIQEILIPTWTYESLVRVDFLFPLSFHSHLPNPLPLDALQSAFDKLTDLQIHHKKTSRHLMNPLYPTLTGASKLDKTTSLPSQRRDSKRVENDWNEQQR